MNEESLKNRRLVAIIIVVTLLLISAFSDGLISKITKKETVDEVSNDSIKNKIITFKNKDLVEEIIKGSNLEDRILIIPINGVIAGNEVPFLSESYNHNITLKILNSIKDDESIKGIILDINSPGGTVYHSAELWNAIRKVQEDTKIPIYTSMASVAASGGYYIAAPTDKIFASEETMTGSIGVIADYINYTELENKLGIKHNVIKSSDHKDIGSSSREMTNEEKKILQETIDLSYDRFIDVVVEGREMSKEKVLKLADGRIYDGVQALENGLIDDIGYLDDVIDTMSKDLKLKDPMVFYKRPVTIDTLSNILKVDSFNSNNTNIPELDILKDLKENYGLNNTPQILYIYGGH